VIECFAAAFDLQIKIPSRDAVRNCGCRNGVAILREADRQHDWVWTIDDGQLRGYSRVDSKR
ncbi:MAG: hypothetical protein KDA47_09125, partial [Planctomycetales bacterium]|nr:hypothetical protein [Planctomycetales bacterium]